jgi:hypothetical protein
MLFVKARKLNITCPELGTLFSNRIKFAGNTLLNHFGQFIPGYRTARQNTAIFIATFRQTSSLASKKIVLT